MNNTLKFALILILVIGLIVGGGILFQLNGKARIGVGYMVKVTCSEVFVAKRDVDTVLANDFFGIDPLMDKVSVKVDTTRNRVTGSLYGLGRSVAVYRPRAGCTVAAEKGVAPAAIPAPIKRKHVYAVNINPDVQAKVDALFDDGAAAHPIHTRGALVVQNGQIIAEQYADGFAADTRQQSWSMAKSITAALVGVMVTRDGLNLEDGGVVGEWTSPEDRRRNISLDDLLHMTSGLDADEVYSDVTSDVTQMLFNSRDIGQFAGQQAYESEPGTVFEYSSATTNLISRVIRERIGDDKVYHALPRTALFDPLSMSSAIFELDPAGTFIGSSYVYATPRDFARFGQLYLQDGEWAGRKILPKSWIDYSRTPAKASNGTYGAHWWVNQSGDRFPDLPRDAFFMGGNDGQYVIVIPSKNAVIVRMGVTRAPATFEDDLYPLLRDIYQAL